MDGSMSDDLIGHWFRERGFGRSPTGTASGWWLAPVCHDVQFEAYSYRHNKTFVISVTATGREIIDVLEVADGLARFRHYIVNPVGVGLSWCSLDKQFEAVHQVREIALRKKLKRLRMRREETFSGNVIAFQVSKIVRRHAPGEAA
jgi:hypothetical protein